jgi:hypothetical protein
LHLLPAQLAHFTGHSPDQSQSLQDRQLPHSTPFIKMTPQKHYHHPCYPEIEGFSMPTAKRIAINRANPQKSTSSGNLSGFGHIPLQHPKACGRGKWGGPHGPPTRNPNNEKPRSQLRSATFQSQIARSHESTIRRFPARHATGTLQIAAQNYSKPDGTLSK